LSLTEKIIEWAAIRFKIPPIAMRMFKASNDVSGIDKRTLPVELIPLNSIQLSRGLLNYTIIQSKLDWILPYWAEEQYNPKSSSFIPRSHLGLSMNVTHRNWTMVGNPNCSIEPVIDQHGLLMPFRNGWSIDVWINIDNEIFYPSRSKQVSQMLIDDAPIIETTFKVREIEFKFITFVSNTNLIHQILFPPNRDMEPNLKIILSIRPFNPEGISLLKKIQFIDKENYFIMDGVDKLYFDVKPDFVYCSCYKDGDAASILKKNDVVSPKLSSTCNIGLASAIASFDIKPNNITQNHIELSIPLKEDKKVISVDKNEVAIYWKNILSEGTVINIPHRRLNSILNYSLMTLLMLVDDDTITPGPFTYHQFWFRDASYMVWALDNFGFGKYTKRIIESYAKHQEPNGYFRSQKGEWDSNGQALWSVYQHYNLYNDRNLLERLFDSLFLGVKWIKEKRLVQDTFKNEPFYGLMPIGLSAEHLGLADHYFWDDFWSLAGLNSFLEICKILGKNEELEYTQELFNNFSKDLNRAITFVQEKYSIDPIPASPSRGIDCGMIGCVSASYPLQLFDPADSKIISTLKTLEANYFIDGLFFQHFIHSGLNIYLTLQIAHAYLYAGNREKFWSILNSVMLFASPTLNFPEALHPITKGGVMGDGHHGWAAAEIVLALHDAFLFERIHKNEKEFVFLQGIPKEWFLVSTGFNIKNAHTSAGMMEVEVSREKDIINIGIKFFGKTDKKNKWFVCIPFKHIKILDGNNQIRKMDCKENEVELEMEPGNINLKFSA
jgi:hypothetical protein